MPSALWRRPAQTGEPFGFLKPRRSRQALVRVIIVAQDEIDVEVQEAGQIVERVRCMIEGAFLVVGELPRLVEQPYDRSVLVPSVDRPLAADEHLRRVSVLTNHTLDEDVKRADHLLLDLVSTPLVIIDVRPDLTFEVAQEILVGCADRFVVHLDSTIDLLGDER